MASLWVENVVLDGRRGDILCDDGVIAEIRYADDDAAASGDPRPGPPPVTTDRLDGKGCLVAPSMINCHTHTAMTLFRGRSDDLPLMQWLQTQIWPYEAVITEEQVYAGARLGILEMVRSGTSFFNDMYWSARGTARAVMEMGVRACIGPAFIDRDAPEKTRDRQAATERLLDDLRGCSSRVSLAVAPHAVYTVTDESLRWMGELAAEYDLPVHIHLCETATEIEWCETEHGCSPVAYLDRLGLLNGRTIAAHTVWLSDDDIAVLGERQVVCVHSPVSNMKLAVGGVYPYRRLAAAGAVCAIGTDGAASNNSLDLFREIKLAALLQKHHDADPSSLPADEALAMATSNPASVFGLPGSEIAPGRAADFILIDGERPELSPSHSLTSDLVYSATGNVVDSLICDGRVIMRHREIDGEEEIIAEARQAARQLFSRL